MSTDTSEGPGSAANTRPGVLRSVLRPPAPVLLVLLVTLVVFLPVCRHPFIDWDDDRNVYQNPYLQSPGIASIVRAWQRPYFYAYIPVTRTIWTGVARLALEHDAHGMVTLRPETFHAANLLVHLLNVLLVFAILRRLVKKDWAAATGALLFGLHPLQVEPVAWVTGMKDLAGALFSLLCLWQYVCFAQRVESGESRVEPDSRLTTHDSRLTTPESPARPLARSRIHYVLALLCFGVALLAKASTVTVPLIAWAVDTWLIRRKPLKALKAVGWWVLLAVPVILITRSAERAADAPIALPIWSRLLIAGDAFAFYLAKLVWPARLSIDYGRTPEFVLAHWWGYATWLLPAALVLAAWKLRRTHPWLPAACATSVAALLPVSGLVPFVFQYYSTVADRYAYVALLGPALAVAWLLTGDGRRETDGGMEYGSSAVLSPESGTPLHHSTTPPLHPGSVLRPPSSVLASVYAAALLLLAGQSLAQEANWKSTWELFGHALAINPRSWVAHNNMGYAYMNAGKLREAEAEFRSAIARRSDYAEPESNLAATLAEEGRTGEAIAHFQRAIQLCPKWADPHSNLGFVLFKQNRPKEAVAELAQAVRLEPGFAAAHYNLAMVLGTYGKPVEAAQEFREAIRLIGRYPEAHKNLGAVLTMQGKLREAAAEFQTAIQEDPRLAEAHYNLGAVLCLLGDKSRGAEEFREALRLQPDYAQARNALKKTVGG